MKCVYCGQPVPDKCSGKIEHHCDWCGGPVALDADIPPDGRRWCSQKCFSEQSEDVDFGWTPDNP